MSERYTSPMPVCLECCRGVSDTRLHDAWHVSTTAILKERDDARAEVERLRAAQPSCTCDRNPETTSGPEEDCEEHGERRAELIRQRDELRAAQQDGDLRVDGVLYDVETLPDLYRRTAARLLTAATSLDDERIGQVILDALTDGQSSQEADQ